VEDGFIYDAQRKVAAIELELDDEIYVAAHPDMCADVKSAPRLVTCEDSCDYTIAGPQCDQPSEKLKHLNDYNNSCTCGHPDWCRAEWTTLQVGETIRVEQGEWATFRFFMDSLDGYTLSYEIEVSLSL